jgi:hypothetical protein
VTRVKNWDLCNVGAQSVDPGTHSVAFESALAVENADVGHCLRGLVEEYFEKLSSANPPWTWLGRVLTLRSMAALRGDFANPLIETSLCARNKPGCPLCKAIIVPPRQERVTKKGVNVGGVEQACSTHVIGDVSLCGCSRLHAEPGNLRSSLGEVSWILSGNTEIGLK